ncbi:hypothetical protein D3C84_931470 [compost metagenome]
MARGAAGLLGVALGGAETVAAPASPRSRLRSRLRLPSRLCMLEAAEGAASGSGAMAGAAVGRTASWEATGGSGSGGCAS